MGKKPVAKHTRATGQKFLNANKICKPKEATLDQRILLKNYGPVLQAQQNQCQTREPKPKPVPTQPAKLGKVQAQKYAYTNVTCSVKAEKRGFGGTWILSAVYSLYCHLLARETAGSAAAFITGTPVPSHPL